MKKIWAPWRIEYILQPKDDVCFICNILNDDEKNDRTNLLLFRGKNSIVVLNKFPYISGHLMIAPILHTTDLSSIASDASVEMWFQVTQCVELLKATIKPDGFNIGMNLGKVAGAGLESHVHIHIVPRWSGDTNFMPIISDTRVISQALTEMYDILKKEKSKYFK
ncbi:MAG: HIT domain-containing protein [Asgard group archaeon]|nr:HIT domain-containing protein [Asgard group archaeon]